MPNFTPTKEEVEQAYGTKEEVDHPDHYNQHPSGVECIDIIEWMPANIAMAMKHLWRCDLKHPSPTLDFGKAIWYIERETRRREKMKKAKTSFVGAVPSDETVVMDLAEENIRLANENMTLKKTLRLKKEKDSEHN